MKIQMFLLNCILFVFIVGKGYWHPHWVPITITGLPLLTLVPRVCAPFCVCQDLKTQCVCQLKTIGTQGHNCLNVTQCTVGNFWKIYLKIYIWKKNIWGRRRWLKFRPSLSKHVLQVVSQKVKFPPVPSCMSKITLKFQKS